MILDSKYWNCWIKSVLETGRKSRLRWIDYCNLSKNDSNNLWLFVTDDLQIQSTETAAKKIGIRNWKEVTLTFNDVEGAVTIKMKRLARSCKETWSWS